MVGTACESFRNHFGRKAFLIRSLCRAFTEKMKIQEHHPFRIGFGFTLTCIMIVYENILQSGTNLSRNGD